MRAPAAASAREPFVNLPVLLTFPRGLHRYPPHGDYCD